jgi:predicted nucleotidyltransferase
MITNFAELIRILVHSGVEFIIIGGAAARAHGSARLTEDLDIVYHRTPENIERLVAALDPFHPYLRGVPQGLPFEWSSRTIQNGLNFTLKVSLGAIDLFGEIVGGGGYEALLPQSERIALYGVECFCLSLRALLIVKRAAGRPKDLELIAELEAIIEESHGTSLE